MRAASSALRLRSEVKTERITPVRRGFLFPTTALSKVFRGKYLDFLTAAYRSGELRMPGDDTGDTQVVFVATEKCT